MIPDAQHVGERIRALRRRHHLTQAELAAKVGIRTGPLNTLENGHHLPSLRVLCKLASVLGADANALLQGTETGTGVVRETAAPYLARNERPFAATPDSYESIRARMIRFEPDDHPLDEATLRRIEGVMNVFLALEDICAVQKRAEIPLTLKLPASEAGLERMVSRVRALLGVSDAVIFDYLELFENVGLRVVFLTLPAEVESVSYYDRDCDNAFFFIRRGMKVERQLFRLACELGRVYLYNSGLRGQRTIGRHDARHAAKLFASFLLMPEEAVLTSVRQAGVGREDWSWELLLRLKHRFGVSAESFLYRLEELNLIAPEGKQALKARIYAHYEATGCQEPDRSRRMLSPNGRLGDLLLAARQRQSPELPKLRRILKSAGVQT